MMKRRRARRRSRSNGAGARLALVAVSLASVLVVVGCRRDAPGSAHPCQLADAYAQRAAEAQGRADYLRRGCEDDACPAEQRAVGRLLRVETTALRRLAAKANAVCGR